MTEINWQQRILELALEEKRVKEQNDELRAEIDAIREERISHLELIIADSETELENMRESLKLDFKNHVESTGDFDVHPALTYVRKTKLMYDKAEIIAEAQANGADNVLRIKTELDVRAFEKAIKDGKAKWAMVLVEETAAPYVTIAKLGEYVIAYEAGLLDSQEHDNDGS